MKKDNKYIVDNPNTLDESYLFIKDNKLKSNLVMSSFEDEFIVVDEFKDDLKNVKLEEEEVIENDDGFIYAEEIFDDEDDIYANNIKDTAVIKAKHRTFVEIGNQINDYLVKYSYSSKTVGLNLLSSMFFSRIINLKRCHDLDNKVQAILNSFSSRRNVIKSYEDENIAHNNTFNQAIINAKSNINKPVFIYLSDISSKEIFNYLKPLYPYIDNPSGDTYITARGTSIKMPKNVYILFSLKEEDSLFDIPRRLLRFVSIMEVNMEETRPVQINDELIVSLEELRATLNETNESRVLLEDSWKNIDSLAALIGTVNGYSIQNKIALRIEDFSSTLFSTELSEDEIVDIALSRNVISEAIITSNPAVYFEEVNLFNEIDNTFGNDKLPLTREVIKSYMALFDKGGNRINE